MLDKMKMKQTANLKKNMSIFFIYKHAAAKFTNRLGDLMPHEDFSSSQPLLNPLTQDAVSGGPVMTTTISSMSHDLDTATRDAAAVCSLETKGYEVQRKFSTPDLFLS